MYMKVYTTSNEHIKCFDDCKMAFMTVLTEMSKKLESENINAENVNSKIILEMQAILDQVDKFFTEDLYRDNPTGMINYSLVFILLLYILDAYS